VAGAETTGVQGAGTAVPRHRENCRELLNLTSQVS
jgi:hypothetical protein